MEEWRAVRDFPLYEVSSMGALRSWQKSPNEKAPPLVPRILRGGIDKDGYRRAVLCTGKRRTSMKIHHLVMEAFGFSRPFASAVTRHLDGDKANNAASNLRWGTQKENIADRERHRRLRKSASSTAHTAERSATG